VLTLAIATSTPQVSVAVGAGDEALAALAVRGRQRHAEVLTPAIESCARLAGVRIQEVERIAVDTGPGLFTGLRVGVATAKALASALDLDVVACSSLDLLAHPHRQDGRKVAAVVDARRGEVFWAMYRPDEGEMLAVTEAAVAAPGDLAAALRGEGAVLVTGDGARRYRDELVGMFVAPPEFDHPSASALLALSAGRPGLHPDKVTPVYVRGADVRIGWERRNR
jgi:tRNA threonylcarbamoyladenosine biosynthesis protein TsaB